MQKIKQHYDIFINDKKYKVLTCNICEEKKIIIKNKNQRTGFSAEREAFDKYPFR